MGLPVSSNNPGSGQELACRNRSSIVHGNLTHVLSSAVSGDLIGIFNVVEPGNAAPPVTAGLLN